jgi:hypothetical protein
LPLQVRLNQNRPVSSTTAISQNRQANRSA